jgi:hypothetical protein
MGASMNQSKLEITVGNLSFSGEGEQSWLAEQLEKVLKAAPTVATAQMTNQQSEQSTTNTTAQTQNFTTTLASYIRDKGGDSNQVDRFLITADWLRRKGVSKLTTAEVSSALKNNQQKRLANAAECLNRNVSKGYCEKVDGGFYISPDGLRKLGHDNA